MDPIDKLQTQITELLKARDFLLNQTPSDMVAVASITEKIIDLTRRLTALVASTGPIRALTPGEVAALQDAVRALAIAVQRSAAASHIVEAATKLANA
jgi:hypothetical protein